MKIQRFLQIAFLLSAPFFLSTPALAEPCRGVVFSTFNQADYNKLVDMKVNLVRYDIIWDDSNLADASDAASYSAWLAEELDFFDIQLAKLKALNIAVNIVLHTPPGGFASRTGQVTHRIFTESWAQQELISSWQEIATRYLGETGIHSYDIANEPAQFSATVPAGLKDWNGLAKDVVQAIRAIDPTKPIVVSSLFGDPRKFKTLDLLPYDNILYSFHFYHPFKYTHQGLGKKWNKKYYPTPQLNKKKLAKVMAPAYKFQKDHGVDLFVGEFAVARWAPGGDRYLRDVINLMEDNNTCWTYNSFGIVDVWSFEYTKKKNDLNKSPTPTKREKLLRTYFNRND